MAIKIIPGNFLEATENLLCQQVNCQGVMGSNKATLSTNVAHQIRQKWPKVYDEYMSYCRFYGATQSKKEKELLGMTQGVEIDNDKFIVNMYAQLNYGNDGALYTNYEAFEKGLYSISAYAKHKEHTVAMPYMIGCDRGGASWDKIYELLNKYFGSTDQPNLTLYKLK